MTASMRDSGTIQQVRANETVNVFIIFSKYLKNNGFSDENAISKSYYEIELWVVVCACGSK